MTTFPTTLFHDCAPQQIDNIPTDVTDPWYIIILLPTHSPFPVSYYKLYKNEKPGDRGTDWCPFLWIIRNHHFHPQDKPRRGQSKDGDGQWDRDPRELKLEVAEENHTERCAGNIRSRTERKMQAWSHLRPQPTDTSVVQQQLQDNPKYKTWHLGHWFSNCEA